MDYDVIVVGGGPAGLIAARDIAREGYRVYVLEEHQEIGYPVKCSGLFSISGLKTLGLKLDEEIISNTIKGGRFFSPGGKEFFAYSNVERARVVERKLFDKHLANEAVRAGAKIKLKTKVTGIKINREVGVTALELGKSIILKSRILIGADGVRSNIARWAGLPTLRKIVSGVQVEVDKVEVEEDVAEVYLGRGYAPNFYGWILPKDNVYEVGIGAREPKVTPRKYLMKFMKEHPIVSKKIESQSILELNMGAIPVDRPIDSVAERVMIVGDAAGHTKATTGGGVITGGIASTIAAEASIKALEEGDFSRNFLKREYEERWEEEIGFELEVHYFLRQLFDSLKDEQIDELFDIAEKENLRGLMIRYKDTDRPSEFVKELLKKKRVFNWIKGFIEVKEDFK